MNFSQKEKVAMAFSGVLFAFINLFAVAFVAGANPACHKAFDPMFAVVMGELLASFVIVVWLSQKMRRN